MNEFLWVEKYRPKTVDDCILSADLHKTFSEIVKAGEIQIYVIHWHSGCR